MAGSDNKVVHLALPLRETDVAIEAMELPNIAKGHQTYFGVNPGREDSLTLTLTSDDSLVKAHGSVKVGRDNFALTDMTGGFEQAGSYIVAGLFGTVQSRRGVEEAALWVVYDPTDHTQAFASLTVGAIDAELGTAVAFYGNLSDSKLQGVGLVQPKNPSVESQSAAQSESVASVTGVSDYPYKGSAYGWSLGESTCGACEPASYADTGKFVIGMNTWARDPSYNGGNSGSVQIRVWGNTDNVVAYLQSYKPNAPGYSAYVDNAFLRLREYSGNGDVNITNAGPPQSTIQTYSYLGYIPDIGKYLTYYANWAAKNTATVQHSSVTHPVKGRKYQYQVKVYDLGHTINYTGADWYNSHQDQYGGVTAFFDYSEYVTGTFRMSAGGRVSYVVGIGYYAYMWTRWTEFGWDAQ